MEALCCFVERVVWRLIETTLLGKTQHPGFSGLTYQWNVLHVFPHWRCFYGVC
jgi:hypothetical protein